MINKIKSYFRKIKLISIIESVAPADSKYKKISEQGIAYIEGSGYKLLYINWRDLPLWVLEYYAKQCILSNESLKIKHPKGEIK